MMCDDRFQTGLRLDALASSTTEHQPVKEATMK